MGTGPAPARGKALSVQRNYSVFEAASRICGFSSLEYRVESVCARASDRRAVREEGHWLGTEIGRLRLRF